MRLIATDRAESYERWAESILVLVFSWDFMAEKHFIFQINADVIIGRRGAKFFQNRPHEEKTGFMDLTLCHCHVPQTITRKWRHVNA